MIIFALLIGVILLVAAIRNSQADLFTALGTDVPGFVVWGAALFAVGAIGYVPGLKPISRGLLALVLIVIILQNYQTILSGFQSVASEKPPATTAPASTPSSSSSSGGSTASSLMEVADVANSFASVAGA